MLPKARWLLVLAPVGGALFGVSDAGARGGARCSGDPASITGSGVINGTAGRDLIVGSTADDEIDGGGG